MTGDTTRASGFLYPLDTPSGALNPIEESFYGTPTLAMGWWRNLGISEGQTFIYPDPSNPPYPVLNPSGASPVNPYPFTTLFSDNQILTFDGTNYGVTDYSLVSGLYDIVCHQNRIIGLRAIPQNWGALGPVVYANELFDYPDPPGGLALPLYTADDGSTQYRTVQDEVFVQEHPFGHGAWGSISASELFLVKHNGGGYVIMGDLNAPTVIRLPGVTSTYGMMSRTADTPIGLVYASRDRGLWAWNGGNTSAKISTVLEDSSFATNTSTVDNIQFIHGPEVDCRPWGDWLVASNNWLMNTGTGSWWQLPYTTYDSTGDARKLEGYTWYGTSADGRYLYAAEQFQYGIVPTQSTAYIDVFDRLTPSNAYSWTSYAIRPPDLYQNRVMDITEVAIRAQGSGTIQITLTGPGGDSGTRMSPNNTVIFDLLTQPDIMRRRTSVKNADDIIIEVIATGSAGLPAPILYSISIGYSENATPTNRT